MEILQPLPKPSTGFQRKTTYSDTVLHSVMQLTSDWIKQHASSPTISHQELEKLLETKKIQHNLSVTWKEALKGGHFVHSVPIKKKSRTKAQIAMENAEYEQMTVHQRRMHSSVQSDLLQINRVFVSVFNVLLSIGGSFAAVFVACRSLSWSIEWSLAVSLIATSIVIVAEGYFFTRDYL
jgi:hypothetical protein